MQFVSHLAYVFPTLILWWAIAYLVVIKRKKIRVGGAALFISFLVPGLVLAWLKGRGFDDPIIAPLVLGFLSCSLLRWIAGPPPAPPGCTKPDATHSDSVS